jgi:rod shape-determining protein MreC
LRPRAGAGSPAARLSRIAESSLMKGRDRPFESSRPPSRTLTLLATCLLLAVALIGVNQTPLALPLRGFLDALVAPLQRGASQLAYGLNSWAQTANSAHTLEQDNAALREDIARLQTENAQLRGLRTENSTLRQMLGFQQEHPDLQSLPASVVGRDPSGLSRMLILDRGSADGVGEGMAVTSPGGLLLGRVITVSANQSSVLLVDDIDSSIAVKVDRSNVDAIVQGQAQHGGRLLVRRIAQNADVARGDLIKTSGTGGTLPKGLLVGQIYEIHQKDIDQDQEALAYPLAIPETIDQVLVITGEGAPGAPRPTPAPAPTGSPTGAAIPALGLPTPLYPVPATATPEPTRTPIPTMTPLPTLTPTRTPVKKR